MAVGPMPVRIAAAVLAAAWVTGCASPKRLKPPATQPVTAPATLPSTTPAFPAQRAIPEGHESRVTAADFDRLWQAARDATHERLFRLDRTDYRGGVMTTEPLVSKQFFEFWRGDATTAGDVAESSLATVRRTVRFDFERIDNGQYAVVPVVTVERFSNAERRVTTAVLYRNAFRRGRTSGTPETDRGVTLPSRYWYPLGRDLRLEEALAKSIARKVR